MTDNVGMLIDRPKSAEADCGRSRSTSDTAARTWWHWAWDRAGSARGGGGGRAPPNTPRTTPPPPRQADNYILDFSFKIL